jgi:hypothetical protein
MTWVDPFLQRYRDAAGDLVVRLGVPQLDVYLQFLAARSRPNTVLVVGYDLRVFFAVVGKPPAQVIAADVLGFVTVQHTGAALGRLQVAGGVGGVSARTVRRRLSSVSGLYTHAADAAASWSRLTGGADGGPTGPPTPPTSAAGPNELGRLSAAQVRRDFRCRPVDFVARRSSYCATIWVATRRKR